jgi:hypothetical protein
MRGLLLALGLLLVCAVASEAAGPQPARAVVEGFLLADPAVSPRVKATIRSGSFHAGIDRVLHADLTGDGRDETVVSVFSGGTAGDIAFYVLTGDGSGRHLIKAANQEYKVGVKIVAGALQVTRPLYRASDPNCCPAHLEITTYRYDGRRLVAAHRVREKTPTA